MSFNRALRERIESDFLTAVLDTGRKDILGQEDLPGSALGLLLKVTVYAAEAKLNQL
jgi:hypothetical protein